MDTVLFNLIIGVLVLHYGLDLLANILNVRALDVTIPEEFKDTYNQEKYASSQRYLKDNVRLSTVLSTVNICILIPAIYFGLFNTLDLLIRELGLNNLFTGLLYFGALFLVTKLMSLPFDIYKTFYIEEKYEFNTTTLKTFCLDLVKELVLVTMLGGAILTCILWFFEFTGSNAWLYIWGFLMGVQLLLLYIIPSYIMPLFNKFTPLEDKALEEKIFNYAKKYSFPMKDVFVMDGSKRSKKSNAFFAGFGKSRRVVLYDTLVHNHTHDELLGIFAHEVGHYKHKHLFKQLIIGFFSTGLMLYLLNLTLENPILFSAFKMDNLSIYASLVLFSFIVIPVNFLVSLVLMALSRKYEYQADAYAVTTTQNKTSFIAALKQLSVDNLANLTPHPFKVFVEYSHPPLLQRIAHIKSIQL